MSYQAIKYMDCEVKEANLNRLLTPLFQLYDILEKAKLWR